MYISMLHVHTNLVPTILILTSLQNEATIDSKTATEMTISKFNVTPNKVCAALPVTTQLTQNSVTPAFTLLHPSSVLSDYNMPLTQQVLEPAWTSLKGLEEPERKDNYDLGTVRQEPTRREQNGQNDMLRLHIVSSGGYRRIVNFYIKCAGYRYRWCGVRDCLGVSGQWSCQTRYCRFARLALTSPSMTLTVLTSFDWLIDWPVWTRGQWQPWWHQPDDAAPKQVHQNIARHNECSEWLFFLA